ncbi:SGNH hydrolase domain-containing protein [Cellulomonas sp. A375-1]|uniref:SGNH hydrolase domain-containing protein n=1 Tax=Cellulomonas sp. A375-1 TaxID=1672219 RepID=UPI00069CDED1|nr:SGNH hydrolase domain-containing protein [Cellulomonas sp. A375-1]
MTAVDPRGSRRPRTRTIVVCVVVVLVAALASVTFAMRAGQARAVLPTPEQAASDVPQLDGRRCLTDSRAASVVLCAVGPTAARTTVAVVGDTAAEQLLPALAPLADARGWRLTTDLRDGCPLVDAAVTTAGAGRVDCGRPYESRLERLVDDPAVSHVLLVGTAGAKACTGAGCQDPDRAVLERELRSTIQALQRAGKDVVTVRDLPVPPRDVVACVEASPRSTEDCDFAPRPALGALAAAARRELVPVVDLTADLCPDASCPAVADGVLRYRPDGRLTATYAATLSSRLGSALDAAGLAASDATSALGAHALGDEPRTSPAGEPVDTVAWIPPPVAGATRDEADPYREGCHQNQADPTALSCTYGDPTSTTVIALVGDSHAAQWQPALRAVAEAHGWQLRTYTKSACLFADVTVWNGAQDGAYTSCAEWTAEVVDALRADPPTVLIPVSTGRYALAAGDGPVRGDAAIVDGMVRTWSAVAAGGTRVVPIADTPWLETDMKHCVADHLERLSECAVPRAPAVARSAQAWQRAAVARVPRAELVDLTDVVCPADRCAPVIGNVLVWRDSHHLTATYARTTAPFLDEALTPLVRPASTDR